MSAKALILFLPSRTLLLEISSPKYTYFAIALFPLHVKRLSVR